MSMKPVRPTTVLVITSAATFLLSLDLFIVNIAFPAIGAAFPASNLADLSWILNSYTIVFAAVLGLAGRLANRHGHRRLFLIGLGVFTAASASAACAAAPTVWLLVAARALQGIGAALVMPSSLSLLLAAWPPQRRGGAVGTWASIGAVAAALGPPVGGLLVAASWEWVFLVNIPIGILALVAGARVLRETDTARSGRPDVLGAACLIVGVGALAYALVVAPEHGWLAVDVLVAAGIAVAGLAAVVLRSRRHPVPAVETTVLKVPQMALAAAMMLLFVCGFAGMLIVNVAYLTRTWGWTAQAAGLALSPGPVVVVVVSRLAGQAMARIPVGVLATLGSLCFAAGAGWWLLRLGQTQDYWAGMLPGQLLTGLGVGLVLPTLSSVVGYALAAEHWGSGSSLISTARQVGTVLGVALIVTVMGTDGSSALPARLPAIQAGWTLLASAAACAAVVGVVFIVVERRLRAPVETVATTAAEAD